MGQRLVGKPLPLPRPRPLPLVQSRTTIRPHSWENLPSKREMNTSRWRAHVSSINVQC